MVSSDTSSIKRPLRLEYPEALPISAKRSEIVSAIRDHQVVIVSGETGSGKTTQLPKMCLEAGLGERGKIGCTQPRRIAALSVSRRIAEELDVPWGDDVGCKIRFSDKTRPGTRIKVMTDGILLAETRSDPQLEAYEAIIIDEAHERSLNIDFLLGYLKRLVASRKDLKVVITSATIDTKLFSSEFGNAPIFEVTGRSYPVEIRYAPLEEIDGDLGSSYVDGAVSATVSLVDESSEGDILIFMPSERDIREAREILSGRLGSHFEVLPLMGSLSAGEQERVFLPSKARKVIVATNIAETSLTIPNIRYVVDTGLARLSRYNPKSRTKRLPIEPIAQSSANQRAGRAGRVRSGVCVRLFSEEEFLERPQFADPEIARANLAEVILQMKAFNLGEIEKFPFLQAPDERAVRGGYTLLQELGAIDSTLQLKEIGRELARLPLDPTIGRMLLQSRREHCVHDVAVIAAGLSIQDPRERPLEHRQKAEEAHKKFTHPDSDFLSLLCLWDAYNTKWRELKTQNQVRKYCKANFLSFLRLREWTEIYDELIEAVASKDEAKSSGSKLRDATSIKRFDDRYRAIHRSVLSGLLGQVALRIERNMYRASGGRELALFPGSTLMEKDRRETSDASKRQRKSHADPSKESWIVAGEIVETARVYARSVALIDPAWIEDVGRHLVKQTVESPEWDKHTGFVSARERITLGGLLIAYRRVNYARLNPAAAKDIFIRSALLSEDTPIDLPFVERNRKSLDKAASRLARLGGLDLASLHEKLVAFYDRVLPEISSTRELKLFARDALSTDPASLEVSPEELLPKGTSNEDLTLFPDTLEVAGAKIELAYRYEPRGERDGVTLSLPLSLARQLPAHTFDSAVPGLREQQVLYLLRGLSKNYRSTLPPLDETSRRIANDSKFIAAPLGEGLAEVLQRLYGVTVPNGQFDLGQLPDHLRPRIEVVDGKKVVGSGRSLSSLQKTLPLPVEGEPLPAWTTVRTKWERTNLQQWDFGDLPEAIEVATVGGMPIYLHPAVVVEGQEIALRLFENRMEAQSHSSLGINALIRKDLAKEFRDLEKQSKAIDKAKPLITLYTSLEVLRDGVLTCAANHMFERENMYPLTQTDFENARVKALERIPNLVPTIISITKSCLEFRQRILSIKKGYPDLRSDLDRLLAPTFLTTTSFEQLRHMPRYLKAIVIRAERAESDPHGDRAKAIVVERYSNTVRALPPSKEVSALYWMVEELKVSTFAQELGTAYPISPTRLDKALLQLGAK